MELEFVNKIWVKSKGRISIVQRIILICGIIVLLMSGIQLILGGIEDVDIYTGVILPFGLIVISRMYFNSSGYVSSMCKLNIDKNGIIVFYPSLNIKRKDDYSEKIMINYQDIIELQYSQDLHSIRIFSHPIIETVIKGISHIDNYKNTMTEHTCILYFPKEKSEEIVNYLMEECGVNVRIADRMN